MHPHPRKVVAEALLHILPQHGLQRPARACEGTIYTGRRRTRLLARLSRKALDARRRATDVGTRRLRQHLLGAAISLLLVNVAGLVDLKLRLQSHHLLLAALCAF